VDYGGVIGFEEGRNLEIHWRGAEGDNARLPKLADELVQQRVNIIVAIGDGAVKAVMDITDNIPVVMVAGDPVKNGLGRVDIQRSQIIAAARQIIEKKLHAVFSKRVATRL
jgi:ABC-type uncharacterized transport system substrate-binding protein